MMLTLGFAKIVVTTATATEVVGRDTVKGSTCIWVVVKTMVSSWGP